MNPGRAPVGPKWCQNVNKQFCISLQCFSSHGLKNTPKRKSVLKGHFSHIYIYIYIERERERERVKI